MTRVELPEGNWAELRAPKAVPERLRRPVKTAMVHLNRHREAVTSKDPDALSDDALDAADRLNDLVAVALVAEWSFDLPISEAGVQDLPGDCYDRLREHVAPLALQILPSYGVDGVDDPKAGTGV